MIRQIDAMSLLSISNSDSLLCRSLAPQYRNRHVLVVGNNAKQIGKVDIGLQNVTTSHEVP